MSDSNKYANVDYRLKNLTNALYLTEGDDVAVRTGITGNIVIAGNVNIPGTVTVDSSPENPVHNHITEVGTSGNLSVPYLPIGGNVNANVSGTVAVSSLPNVVISSLPEVEIKNDTGNPIPISANTSVNSDTNPIFVKGTSDTSFFAPTQSDAFGRLRVSNPFTIADFFNRYQDNSSSFNYTSGTASVAFDANNASVTMTVGTNSGDTVYRETSKVFAYQPGKSLLILQTFTMAAAQPNLTQRVGYFDTANGFYLEQVGSTINFVKRSSVSGALVETRVSQDNWNVNTLADLDLTKSQIFWMDIEWLGVGSVRMGFVIDGEFVHCHTWHHANIITGVYTTTSCLPLRREIFNTGATGMPSTMYSICASVVSEGGYSFTGREFCIGHNLGSAIALPNDLSFKPIMSIRLKSSRLGAIVIPTTYNVTPVQQAIYKYQIYKRAITTGGTWTSAGANSSVEYNLAPTGISSGEVVLSAFINATNQASGVSSVIDLGFEYQLERNSFTSTCYEYVIAVASSTNSTDCYGAINWKEVT
jgi:hypothetical protein